MAGGGILFAAQAGDRPLRGLHRLGGVVLDARHDDGDVRAVLLSVDFRQHHRHAVGRVPDELLFTYLLAL